MQLKITADYLLIPVNRTTQAVALRLLDGERLVRYFDCHPCPPELADFTAFYPMKEFRDRTLTIAAGELPSDLPDWIKQTDTPLPQNFNQEALRPQLHFSSRRGWLNDPNGLFHYNGVYHLFYQHNPFSTDWGNMHWGHATSTDLLHWEELDDILYPDELGTKFSGSAFVDHANASGLGNGTQPPILLYYTAAGSYAPSPVPVTQCLAYSTDGGNTFRIYDGNPIIPGLSRENRDPKVVFDKQNHRHLLALYLEKRGDNHYFALLDSTDLIHWEKFQEITLPGSGECPDLYELPVDGNPNDRRWVFSAADGRYRIGHFTDGLFVSESGPHEFYCRQNEGNFYAAQTWDNLPGNRRIQLSWHQGQTMSPRFNMSMGFPVELTLKTFGDGIRLCAAPVPEIEKLHTGETFAWHDFSLNGTADDKIVMTELAEIELDVVAVRPVSLLIGGVEIACDPLTGAISLPGAVLRQTTAKQHFHLHLIVDRTSLEVFAEEGRLYAGKRVIFSPENHSLQLRGDSAEVRTYRVFRLMPIWR